MAEQRPNRPMGGLQPAFGPATGTKLPKRTVAIQSARMALAADKPKEALEALEPIMKSGKPDGELLFLRGVIAERMQQPKVAEHFALESIKILEHPEALLLLARMRRRSGHTDECVRLCDKVIAKYPDHPTASITKGGALEEAGRFDEARDVLKPMLEKAEAAGKEAPPPLLTEWSKILVQDKKYDEAIELIDKIVEMDRVDPQSRVYLLHLQAKACDRKKDYAGAHASAAKANKMGEIEFSGQIYADQVTTLIENWSAGNMADFPISACESELPIFVAGMPRSGTSLIDQVIDAHPLAAGVGELATIEQFAMRLAAVYDHTAEPGKRFGAMDGPKWTRAANDYVREITKAAPKGAQRVVNKALGNNKLVGLIARLFPKTRIIHAIRDPRDVAVSCFMGGFNNRLHPWTTRFEWIAESWKQSYRMMQHWKETLDVPILEVHYERLVGDPENEFPRLIEFLGLDWDDKCMEFHKSRRTVRTLSYDQVNRPLYKTSAGRHKNYEEWFGEANFPHYDPWAPEGERVRIDAAAQAGQVPG